MTQRRMPWLLALLGALLLLRVLVPPRADAPPMLAEALVRKSSVAQAQAAASQPAPLPVALPPEPAAQDTPGNAFAVRPPPAPPYVPPPPPVVVAKVKPAPPPPVIAPVFTEPPPPPVPFQVIGTWDDGKDLGVFLTGPHGTLLARPGVTLQSAYKVVAVTPQYVLLFHVASQRETRLPISNVPPSPQRRP